MTLTDDDKQSPTFRKIMQYMEDRIVQLRMSNDGDLSDYETAKIRGRIAECKGFISLKNERPVVED